MKRCITILLSGLLLALAATVTATAPRSGYYDNSGRDDVLSGGVKVIPITTPRGTFHVRTKRVGNTKNVLLPTMDRTKLAEVKKLEAEHRTDALHGHPLMQGPSELGASGRLLNWDRSKDLHHITVPTPVIGTQYDTMDPKYMAGMAKKLPHGQFLLCPKGSHMAMYDDQKVYFDGLIEFLRRWKSSDTKQGIRTLLD